MTGSRCRWYDKMRPSDEGPHFPDDAASRLGSNGHGCLRDARLHETVLLDGLAMSKRIE